MKKMLASIFGYCLLLFALIVWGKHSLSIEDVNKSKSEIIY